MHGSRSILALSAALSFLLPVAVANSLQAQTAAVVKRSARVVQAVDSGRTVRLSGHVPVFADVNKVPSTALATSTQLSNLHVVLSRAPEVEAAFEQLLADQLDPKSTRFHQWLTPQEVGTLYGPAQSDVDAVTSWLESQGLTVSGVSPNRLFIDFSGPVASVEKAFGTSFRSFSLANGEERYSITQEPTVPAAIQPVIKTIAGLSQTVFYSHARQSRMNTRTDGQTASPLYTTSGGNHYMVAGDFNNAYDITAVLAAGTTGAGQNIAIAGQSRVYANDIAQMEAIEGIASKQPNVIIPGNGKDPGLTSSGDQDEATLDVDRTIGTAPGATIDQVVSAAVGNTSGLDLAISYAIGTVNDPILSISYGGCEALNGSSSTTYYQSVFQTAASQGITTFISSGDSGAATCNAFYTTIPASQTLSINDLCASQYVTCVGGTEFADTSSPASYWSSANSATFTSLQTLPPEGAWNEPSVSSGQYSVQSGTGGGTSVFLPKPSWQTGTGVPAGGFRWIPDLSFSASGHDGYITCLNYASTPCVYSGTTITSAAVFGGTSAAAPSMAGIQALVNQKLGGRQGNINPVVYALGGSFSPVFHDVTVASSGVSSCSATPSLCNNSTPGATSLTGGLAGYIVTTGWDAATGWGSLDVAKYLLALSTPSFSVSPAATSIGVAPTAGTSTTDTITLQSIDGFAGLVTLKCAVISTGSATGTCSISSAAVTLTGGNSASAILTVTNTGTTTGTFNVVVTATSGTAVTTGPTIAVTVANPSFTVTPASTLLTFTSGATTGNSTTLTISSVGGFTGNVALSCLISSSSAPFPPSCSVSPASVPVSSGVITTATLTIGSTPSTSAGVQSNIAPLGWRFGSGATLAMLLFCVPLRKRRRALFQTLAVAGLLLTGLGAMTGCGNGGSTTTLTRRSSAGSYTVTVTAVSGTTVTSTVGVTIQ